MRIEFSCGEQRHFVYFEVKVRARQEHGSQIECYKTYVDEQNKKSGATQHTLGILTIPSNIKWQTIGAEEKINFAVRWRNIVDILQGDLDPGVARLSEYFKDDIKREILMDWEHYELEDWNESIALSFPILIDGAYYLGKDLREKLNTQGGGRVSNFKYLEEGEDQHYFRVNLGQPRYLYVYWVYYENDEEFEQEFEQDFSELWGVGHATVADNIDRYPSPEGGFYAGYLWVGTGGGNQDTRCVKIMKLSEFAKYFNSGQKCERNKLSNDILNGLRISGRSIRISV